MKLLGKIARAAAALMMTVPAMARIEKVKETFSTTISDKLGSGDVYGEITTTNNITDESYITNKEMKIVRRDSKGNEIWKVQDFVRDCEVSADLELVAPIRLTDIDENNLKEVWMIYKLACRGDVSPANMKIIMYEGTRKHAVRGGMRLDLPEELGGTVTGSHEADDAMRKAHEEIYRHSELLWNLYDRELLY